MPKKLLTIVLALSISALFAYDLMAQKNRVITSSDIDFLIKSKDAPSGKDLDLLKKEYGIDEDAYIVILSKVLCVSSARKQNLSNEKTIQLYKTMMPGGDISAEEIDLINLRKDDLTGF
jgi:hypothetical protein